MTCYADSEVNVREIRTENSLKTTYFYFKWNENTFKRNYISFSESIIIDIIKTTSTFTVTKLLKINVPTNRNDVKTRRENSIVIPHSYIRAINKSTLRYVPKVISSECLIPVDIDLFLLYFCALCTEKINNKQFYDTLQKKKYTYTGEWL